MPEIIYIVGDATAPVGAGNKIIVHICNDVGGWGKGFVVALSRRSPRPEAAYRQWHGERAHNNFGQGMVQFVQIAPDLWAANLIGQSGMSARNGVPPVRYESIRLGLAKVAGFAQKTGVSVHMPRIGCGLAGGDWNVVCAIIEDELTSVGVAVTVYDLKDG